MYDIKNQVSSLRDFAKQNRGIVAKQAKCSFFRKQGGAEVSLVIHKESIDFAKSSLRGSNATEAIHKKIDCHESLCDSHNDDSFTFPK